MYAIGSLNSSAVGLYSGQSGNPKGRDLGGGGVLVAREGVLTVDRSRLRETEMGGPERYFSVKS